MNHEWCYRVWVKSFYKGENADRVEEMFGLYEGVFTHKQDADAYIDAVKSDLYKNGFHPFEKGCGDYDCVVMSSTILLNRDGVRLWK